MSIPNRTPLGNQFSTTPKKRLGQHFLKDKETQKRIVRSLEIKEGDFLLEIGPGKGELTFPLLEFVSEKGIRCSYTGIEKDKDLAEALETRLSDKNNSFSVISGDAKELIPEIAKGKDKYKLFGNIPYYITGAVFRLLTGIENKPDLAVLMIQKEVAERLCPKKGEGINRLSAMVSFSYETEITENIGKKSFFPPPKVDSSVVRLVKKENAESERKYWKTYEALAKSLFSQPRKTAANNLSPLFKDEKEPKKSAEAFLASFGMNQLVRPHEIQQKTLTEMSRVLYNKLDGKQKN